MNKIVLDGESLTFEQVTAVAYGRPGEPRVELSEEARGKVRRAAGAVDTLLERGEIAYGITTGFGAFKDKIISREEVELLQKNIVLSHAVGVGDPFDVPTTRAIMLIRANTLARGFSGIRLETLELILEFLNRGIHPVIPEKGSLGASGDLAPLAHFACVLIGEGEAEFDGEVVHGREALRRAGLSPVVLKAKEGLALTNGTTIMTAVGLLETAKAANLARFADVAGCLTLEAVNGTTAAFDERIHAVRPHPRQVACAKDLRQILEGSEMTRSFDPVNVQDAYTLRCIPQVHGACRDTVEYAVWLLGIELNAVTDNPLIFIEGDNIEVISGGNFHGEPLALAFDYLAIALSELANISERRIMRLTDEASNSGVLPAFLTEDGGLNSGFMIVQYTAAALCTENKVLAHPASVDTIPSSANVEDHVSMGATAAIKLRAVRRNLETVLALEAFCAAQAVDLRQKRIGEEKKLGAGTEPLYRAIRERVPFVAADDHMKGHIDNSVAVAAKFARTGGF
ncbi:MAG: histidine ammonia-lyase [Acidobacteria bacterium OLB17]|nr:MAG: histidine ammonia-lyase [Acidobacteria bacterium OLB17]MCZ2392034.1 histidine ammonia-lyase [Acidobacteriota bacterium]